MPEFIRKKLPHTPQNWVPDGETYFITVCCQGRSQNQLCKDTLAEKILESVAIRQERGFWNVRLFLLMPDHLHALISFNSRMASMAQTVRNGKRYLARTYQIKWQTGFFDHRLRNANAVREKADYIRNNPVRAELCCESTKWKYLWDASDIEYKASAIAQIGTRNN